MLQGSIIQRTLKHLGWKLFDKFAHFMIEILEPTYYLIHKRVALKKIVLEGKNKNSLTLSILIYN